MGGLCSKHSVVDKSPSHLDGNFDRFGTGAARSTAVHSSMDPPVIVLKMEKDEQESKQLKEEPLDSETGRNGNNANDFYDGIPRYSRNLSHKSRSMRSTQAAVAKVSEVGARLGKAGTHGIGIAVEVLDTLGSSMTNLNPSSGFMFGVVTKGNEISILAFEVANTIVKGSNLMQSLSKKSIKHLKEIVLPSKGVQHLVTTNNAELLRIVEADKREELKIFSGEVVRFGNRSKDPQWHNLDRYFEKISRELCPQKQVMEEAETVMEQLMILVQYTAELYHELHALDRFELDYERKRQEENKSSTSQKGESLPFLKMEIKGQRKQVKSLKKKSLWSKSLEEVMEKLIDIVHFIYMEIHNVFSSTDDKHVIEYPSSHQRLGPTGLDLHYANIIIQIDTLVARSSSMPPNTRDTLYQSLPPNIKSAFRFKLQSFRVKGELTVTEIKAEMEKTLHWLVPIATNTAKAHHGFGWVGEWANTGSEINQKSAGQNDVILIETLHHADKEKTEAYILELVLWLHYLVSQSKGGGGLRSVMKSPISSPLQNKNRLSGDESMKPQSPLLTAEDLELLHGVSKKKRTPGVSRSQDFDSSGRLIKNDRLSKSINDLVTRGSRGFFPLKKLSSHIPVIDFGIDKKKALDVIDRVDSIG